MNSAPKPAKKRKVDTASARLDKDSPKGREQLIAAAVHLFGSKGYDAVSVRDVADEAGLSFGLIRFYFESKEGLRDVVEKRVANLYMEALAQALNERSLDGVSEAIDNTPKLMADFPDATLVLRRAILDDRPIARQFLRNLLELQEYEDGLLAKDGIPANSILRDSVRNLARRVGFLVLAPQLKEMLGYDSFDSKVLKKRNGRVRRLVELVHLGLASEREKSRRRQPVRAKARKR